MVQFWLWLGESKPVNSDAYLNIQEVYYLNQTNEANKQYLWEKSGV